LGALQSLTAILLKIAANRLAVLMKKPMKNPVNSGSYGKTAAKPCLQRFCSTKPL
jgi:hypothetical protein